MAHQKNSPENAGQTKGDNADDIKMS